MASETFQIDVNQGKRPGLFVLLAGLITTTITMVVLYYLNQTEFQAMGFYVNAVIPAGAILVGLIAGSGYGLGSWFFGAKIGKGLLVIVVLLQVTAYFVAQYFEYVEFLRHLPKEMQPTFLQYFDVVTQAFAFVAKNGKPGEPFGMWGYAMRLLEIAGFAGGGLIAPAVLFTVPYCHRCQVYMKSQELAILPAGIMPRKVKKKDEEGQLQYQQDMKDAMDEGLHLLDQLHDALEANDPQPFRAVLDSHVSRKKEIGKLTGRLSINLQRCPRCAGGAVVVKMVTGQGENISTEEITRWDVDAGFVHRLTVPVVSSSVSQPVSDERSDETPGV